MKEELKGVQSSALLSDQEEHVADTAWAARNNEWLKNLRKDAYLQEAVSVVRDIPK